MARIRTIKPEFPHSESVGKLSRDARLLYIQLWTIVDDEGRARAASRMLASLLYPYDDDAKDMISAWLDELEQGNHIRRYEVDGSHYLEIVKWLDHQKIDKASKSKLPAFDDGSPIPREDSANTPRSLAPDLGPSTMDLVSGSGARESAPPTQPEKKSRKKPRQQIADGYRFPEPVRQYGVKLGFSSTEIDREEQRFIRHAKQNARLCADWDMAAENWLDKSAEFAGKPPPIDAAKAAEALKNMHYARAESPQLAAWDAHWQAVGGKSAPRDRNGGWYFETEWPPGFKAPALELSH
jgi:hypothetical protein